MPEIKKIKKCTDGPSIILFIFCIIYKHDQKHPGNVKKPTTVIFNHIQFKTSKIRILRNLNHYIKHERNNTLIYIAS